jgi:hypothetical protein
MEDPRIISALFISLKMAYYNVLINSIPFTPQRLEKREKRLSKICGLNGMAGCT